MRPIESPTIALLIALSFGSGACSVVVDFDRSLLVDGGPDGGFDGGFGGFGFPADDEAPVDGEDGDEAEPAN